jgi:diguanylate cyclase (GGDEF)-like protein
LIEIDSTLTFARPADKLLTTGWPTALNVIGASDELQKLSLSSLPKKENLITDLRPLLKRSAGLALLVIDLDHFKSVNDTKGHPEGDACLERVVQVIGGVLGRKGTLYRWGGDEFAVSLADFSTEEAHATAERVRHAVEEAKTGHEIAVTTSIGVGASDRMNSPTAEELLSAADSAMYESKRQGKNRVTSWPIEKVQSSV